MANRTYACSEDHIVEVNQSVNDPCTPFFRFCADCGAKRKFHRRIVAGHGGFSFQANAGGYKVSGVRKGAGYTTVGNSGFHNIDYGRGNSDLKVGRATEAAAIHNEAMGVAGEMPTKQTYGLKK